MKKGMSANENPSQPVKQQKPPVMQEYQWITNLVSQFHQQLYKPLEIRESLFKNSEQQRCLIHSIAYSIYCTICRKVLCAGCMYTGMQHRKHRVIPIENASQELKEDIKTFQSKILKVGNQAEGLIDSNGQILMKIQKQYNPLTLKVKQFYENVRVYLKRKQKQHLQLLREIKESATAEISQYNRELGRISHFIMQKLNTSLRQSYKTPSPLASRAILQNLTQASSFVNQSMLDYDKFKFPTDIEKVCVLQTQIELRIDSLVSTFQVPISNNRTLDSKKKKSRSLTKGVSFAQQRSKLQQTPIKADGNPKRKNLSMSNIAGRSQVHRL